MDWQVGSPFAGRMHPAKRAMVGCCVSTLPLRARIAPADTVGDFMARVRAAALGAYQNADAGLHTVMAALGRTHNEPLFQVRPQHACEAHVCSGPLLHIRLRKTISSHFVGSC